MNPRSPDAEPTGSSSTEITVVWVLSAFGQSVKAARGATRVKKTTSDSTHATTPCQKMERCRPDDLVTVRTAMPILPLLPNAIVPHNSTPHLIRVGVAFKGALQPRAKFLEPFCELCTHKHRQLSDRKHRQLSDRNATILHIAEELDASGARWVDMEAATVQVR